MPNSFIMLSATSVAAVTAAAAASGKPTSTASTSSQRQTTAEETTTPPPFTLTPEKKKEVIRLYRALLKGAARYPTESRRTLLKGEVQNALRNGQKWKYDESAVDDPSITRGRPTQQNSRAA